MQRDWQHAWCRNPGLGKTSWPELVGYNGDHAATVIQNENPNVIHAIVLKDGTPVTGGIHCERVMIWVDHHGIVIRTPIIS